MSVETSPLIPALKNIATRLRLDSLRATSESASGHPTTCFSAADIVAAVFFAEMRYDPKNPQHPLADRFILSKGHAAPLLYAAWAEAGFVAQDELLKLAEKGELTDATWDGMPSRLFFKQRILSDVVKAYYAHPTAWSEIGWGGPASPRGYVRMDFDRRDPWEAAEAKPGREDEAHQENLRVGR